MKRVRRSAQHNLHDWHRIPNSYDGVHDDNVYAAWHCTASSMKSALVKPSIIDHILWIDLGCIVHNDFPKGLAKLRDSIAEN